MRGRFRWALLLAFAVAGGLPARAAEPVSNDMLFRRASFQWRTGDVRGAVRTLEGIDFGGIAADSSNVLPRASLLLVAGTIRLGDREALERALTSTSSQPAGTPESRWIVALAGFARGEVVELSPLVQRWFEAVRREAAGEDAEAAWKDLSSIDPKSVFERELVGAASVRAAADVLARGERPDELLERVPNGTDAARRALSMRALLELERNDPAQAMLALVEAYSGGFADAEDRRVGLALASHALEEARWIDAERDLASVEESWMSEARAMEAFAAAGREAPLDWNAWLQATDGSRALLVDVDAQSAALDRAIGAALAGRTGVEPPPTAQFTLASGVRTLGFSLPAPDSALARDAREIAAEREDAQARLDAARASLEEKRADIERRLAYLELGAERTGHEADDLRAMAARIDELIASTDSAVAKLTRLRDEEVRRIAERTARFLALCEENGVIARAIRHWRTEGPNVTRPEVLAPGVPAPAEILEQELAVADTLRSWIEGFGALMPDLVTRSHAEVWEPRAREGPLALARTTRDRILWAARLSSSIDSSLAFTRAPDRLVPFEAAIREAGTELARLEAEERDQKSALLAEALDRARQSHEAEGEGIAYMRSVASYELAVTEADDRARRSAEGLASLGPAARGPEARDRLARFLDAYPASAARGTIRYRLADLEILRAREDFQEKMVSFVGASTQAHQETTALAPFVDYEPALALYRAILAEDPTFEHRDAVLFQAGMILSDQGDPKARPLLVELVELHEDSPFRGRASLRLGDDDFERRDLASASAHFETAAAAHDAEVEAIALYKLGWVQFNLEDHAAAAASFLRLLDLYEANPEALALTDLRREGEESLIHALAQADGPRSFAAQFGDDPRRSFDARVLGGLAQSLLSFNQYDDAAACDSLLLERHPLAPEGLDTARHLIATLEEASRADRAMEARLALAMRFQRDSAWGRAASDSLRDAGDEFARSSVEMVALDRHAAARDSKHEADWNDALTLHERLLEGWPDHAARGRTSFLAGEAAAALGHHDRALTHFEAAAADTGALAIDASWQLVAVRDAAYAGSFTADSTKAGELAANLLREIDRFVAMRPGDARVIEALWRKGDVARRHGRLEESAAAYVDFLAHAPRDSRAPDAAHAAARALFDAGRFADAGDAYDRAVTVARAADADSLADALEPLVPLCHFKQAEAAEADSSHADAARGFDVVAQRWPTFQYADRSLYRAGLAHGRAGDAPEAVRSWNTLLENYPKSDLARDAHLQIASTWKNAGRPEAAARAYERFSEAYPQDPEAQDALLEAADLLATAKDEPAADALRTRYLERFPDDLDTAFAILGERASKEVKSVGPDLPIASLTKRPGSSLGKYLALANKHPDLASAGLLAEVSYLEGEEARRQYESARLTQPIGASIAAKKKLLESVLAEYRQCAELAVEPWSVAGAYRIGESLVTFGEALRESQRPADLTGDDLAAYEEVLERQGWEFFDRGEETWTELLKSAKPSSDEGKSWLAKTREELWPRIAKRFVHRPEMVYPLVAADPPKSSSTTSLTQRGGATNESGS